ncbi:J domain-containing protein [Halobellus sp. EA9]|uniref:J domain-containing protein n=1 Tax=Halobellus sp. EA9 TaxID=3421647 RepID=UPI003EB841EC
MDSDGLLIGIAAVFAGTTVLLTVLAFAFQPFLLLFAAAFAAATYLLWYHASGRLGERIRETARQGGERRRASAASRGPGDFEGFGPGRRAAGDGGGRAFGGEQTGRRRRGGPDGRRAPRTDRNEPTVEEAYRTLGLDPGADEEAVRRAYRERVKAVHPDTDDGDEETFKRVNRAYERLTD